MRYKHFKPVLLAAVFWLCSIMLLSCKNDDNALKTGGVAISFDDHFINEWYALRPLFLKYNAKVTFFITCDKTLTRDEIAKLAQLQKDGHEIGFHGTLHGKSTEIIAAFGPEGYFKKEILPGMKRMREAGFHPVSYAHPGGNHNAQVDSVLFASGFKVLRDVAVSRRKLFGIQWYAIAPRLLASIFYQFDQQKDVHALLIDTDQNLSVEQIREALARAKKEGSACMLFGHEPLAGPPRPGAYGFQVRVLEAILKEADAQGLHFYTMSQLPKVARR